MTKTICLQADEAVAASLIERLSEEDGVRILDGEALSFRCALQNELERYRQTPEAFVPYHKSMETLDRWLETKGHA